MELSKKSEENEKREEIQQNKGKAGYEYVRKDEAKEVVIVMMEVVADL